MNSRSSVYLAFTFGVAVGTVERCLACEAVRSETVHDNPGGHSLIANPKIGRFEVRVMTFSGMSGNLAAQIGLSPIGLVPRQREGSAPRRL